MRARALHTWLPAAAWHLQQPLTSAGRSGRCRELDRLLVDDVPTGKSSMEMASRKKPRAPWLLILL